jgi:hypothetical protein
MLCSRVLGLLGRVTHPGDLQAPAGYYGHEAG